MKMQILLGTALAAVFASPALAAPVAVAATATAGRPQLGGFGFDAAGMDRKVTPGDDFYRYANGGWNDRTEIPADRARWGGFDILRDLSDQRTRAVIEASPNSKAGIYYTTFMDDGAIEAKGAAPLKPVLAAIDAIGTPADLARALGAATRDGVQSPIGTEVDVDLKQNDHYSVYMGQGGLGLPDRDYYLLDLPKFVEARAAYQAHVARMLTLAGIADGEAKARAIFALEKRIAEIHWTRVQSRQVEKLYNPEQVSTLATKYPGFDWAAFLSAARVDGQREVIVAQPSAIAGSIRLIAATPIRTWQDYLAYHSISARAGDLSKAFVDEDFAFRKVLSGTPALKDRWKRGVDRVNGSLGEDVGQLYVAKYFPPEAKAKADELVKNIVAAMRVRLQNLTWMSPETRAKAVAKLDGFRAKIGYPDKWRDYAGLEVVSGDAFGNAVRADRFDYDFNLSKLGKPVDREEWGMTPQTVNAYANPPMNEIVFPAAILQPPFFDPNADPAVNYGGIGVVIGHEISHHFDDQGRKFDPKGNLADWWTAEDVSRFKSYTDKVVAQYGAYEPLPGSHVNGELTLGENMADLAGLFVAHDAWRLSLKGTTPPVIDGWSGEQRFFLGFAQVWRQKARDAALQQQLTTDPHTPGNFRPYVVRNMDAWYSAFDVKPGTKYYLAPGERVHVW